MSDCMEEIKNMGFPLDALPERVCILDVYSERLPARLGCPSIIVALAITTDKPMPIIVDGWVWINQTIPSSAREYITVYHRVAGFWR